MEHTNKQYNNSNTESRLFPSDALFWEMLDMERTMFKAHRGSSEALSPIYMDLRKVYVSLYKRAYQSGYSRIQSETELAAEISKDLNTILDENNLRHDGATLLWRLIQDDEYFISAVHNVLSYHNAAFEEA